MRRGMPALWLLFAILSPAFAADPSQTADSARVSPPSAAALGRVLNVGFAAGREKMSAAGSQWSRIPPADRNDPRVDYAWGLVLLKHRRTREAERQFQTAAARTTPAYLPASQAVVWLQLARKQYVPGFKSLRAFIDSVADDKRPAADAAERLSAAEWTGRAIAALNEIPLTDRQKADVERLDVAAEQQFRDRMLAAYRKGKQAVKSLAGELSVEAVKTRVLAGKKLAKKEKQTRKEIASRKDDVDKSQESLKLTAEQWKDWLDEQEKQTKRSLTRGTREMALLDGRRAAISRSMLLATRQKTALLFQIQRLQQGRPEQAPSRAADIALGRIEQTLLQYNVQQLRTVQQMNALRQTAAATLQQYRAAAKRYQTATGKIAKTNTDLSKLESQLKQQERKLRQINVKQAAAVKQMKRRRASFTTYVKFDVDAEKKRLLESLKN
jgi:hypothetical protein